MRQEADVAIVVGVVVDLDAAVGVAGELNVEVQREALELDGVR
jgi:hypothetical protein